MTGFIKVISKRVILKKNFHKCKNLLNNLYSEAYNQNGFLGAYTYIERSTVPNCEHDTIWTISKWTSQQEWSKWKDCSKRIENTDKSNAFVKKESHKILNKLKQDVFLL